MFPVFSVTYVPGCSLRTTVQWVPAISLSHGHRFRKPAFRDGHRVSLAGVAVDDGHRTSHGGVAVNAQLGLWRGTEAPTLERWEDRPANRRRSGDDVERWPARQRRMTETDRLRPNARPPRREGCGEEKSCKSHRASVSRVRPNGSRLSCGRLARRRKNGGRMSAPARAQTLRFL